MAIRNGLYLVVTGKTKQEIEEKLLERICVYLDIDAKNLDLDTFDADVSVTAGEEAPLDMNFTAACNIRIK